MTAQSHDSPPEVPPCAQTSHSEAQRTYGRLSPSYDLTERLLETKMKRPWLEVVEPSRSHILGLPVEIVMGHKPAASSA